MAAPITESAKSQGRLIQVRSIVQAEIDRERRQQKLDLFQPIQQLKAAGLKVSQIAERLGINRRRIDKWVRLDTLPERSRIQPRRDGGIVSRLLTATLGSRLLAWPHAVC